MKFKEAEAFILKKLEEELPRTLYYHSIQHTLDVFNSAIKFAFLENLSEEDTVLLKIAALFHDSGFLFSYNDHEIVSVKYAKEILPDYGFNDKQLKKIEGMILSTIIPQNAKTLAEKIICDADLDYLGREDFFMKGICLQREWNENGKVISLKDWYILELSFLENHHYHTKSAIELRQQKKMQHLEEIKELMKKLL